MNNRTIAIAVAMALAACCSAAAQARESLDLQITTPKGRNYSARQLLGASFESFASGAITGGRALREYQAIRCDGPWGPQKYRLPLPSGPGYRLRAEGDRLLLQIVQHSVISEDRTIAAMKMHCIDTEPRQLVKSLLEIELERGKAATEQLTLANGYTLEYHYTP